MSVNLLVLIAFVLFSVAVSFQSFHKSSLLRQYTSNYHLDYHLSTKNKLQMNFFEDAFRFFTNLNKEASAKHILMKGPGAAEKLELLKSEISSAEDVSDAFSKIAMKVSECPSASRGGNLGTFKPGMMVKEFDKVVFEEAVGKVHGPIETQFGHHLILITRRYEGEDKDKK